MSGLSISKIFRTEPLPTSGEVTLKRNQNVETFKSNVNETLKDNKITKAEYKTLKDSMVNGRRNLNEVISRAGIASTSQLEHIFAKGNNQGSITVTQTQKQDLTRLLTAAPTQNTSNASTGTSLTNEEKGTINNIKQKLVYDRSELSDRYTNQDFLFSSEISAVSVESQKKHDSLENLTFLSDAKTALKADTKEQLTENMKGLMNKYLKTSAKEYVNINSDTRLKVDNILRPNSQATFNDITNTFGAAVSETIKLARTNIPSGVESVLLRAKAIHLDSYNERNPADYIAKVKETAQNNGKKDIVAAAELASRFDLNQLNTFDKEAERGNKASFIQGIDFV